MQPLYLSMARRFFCIVALIGNVAHGQSVGQQARPAPDLQSAAATLSSPEFSNLRIDAARQAAAVAGSAMNAPKQYNTELLKSPQIQQVAASTQNSNKTIEGSIGENAIRLAQLNLPSLSGPGFDQFASELKFGKFVTQSERGPEIILLIRSLGTRAEKDRAPLLRRLQVYSSQGYPEAVNFVGVIYEYGLFQTPRDIVRAVEFYKAAAQRRYQPALYNLATIAYFGKAGPANLAESERLVNMAQTIGAEGSFRVCGLSAFLQFRQGNRADAMRQAKNCKSALANLPNAAFGTEFSALERIKMLRESIAAGADDGFSLLVDTARRIPNDKNFYFCKYAIIDRIRFGAIPPNLKQWAGDCYLKFNAETSASGHKIASDMATMGIAGFVSSEVSALQNLRRTNRFHHSWSVPYLPFGQPEVDLFQTIMPKGKM